MVPLLTTTLPCSAPQLPWVLEPRQKTPENTGDHKHLWALGRGGPTCFFCGWTLRAVLARAKALEAQPW